MRFDVVGLTCRLKSVLITAMFNIGTGGAIPVVAPVHSRNIATKLYFTLFDQSLKSLLDCNVFNLIYID